MISSDKLFPKVKSRKFYPYNYILAKFPVKNGWCFTLVNDWNNWLNLKYQTKFDNFNTPKEAIIAFLEYVYENKINVRKLFEK